MWAEEMGKRKRKEDVAFRRVAVVLEPATVLREVAREFGVAESTLQERHRNSNARAAAAEFLIRYAGHTQRQAAGLLGMGTGAAVCAQLKRLAATQAGDRILRGKLERLDKQLRIQSAVQKR
jgi:hypothetical protein